MFNEHPFEIKSAAEFLDKNSKIQQWTSILRDSNRKWGQANTLGEMRVMIKKTLEDKKSCNEYQKHLLTLHHRPYIVSIILPEKIIDCFNSDIILKSEIKMAINQASLYTGNINENVIRKSFPCFYVSTLKSLISEVARDIAEESILASKFKSELLEA
jgi:hypothetical protein